MSSAEGAKFPVFFPLIGEQGSRETASASKQSCRFSRSPASAEKHRYCGRRAQVLGPELAGVKRMRYQFATSRWISLAVAFASG